MTIEQLIRSKATAYGVPSDLALALAKRESNLNPSAKGKAGEIGIFQLMPGTAKDLGLDLITLPNDVNAQIDGGLRYLSQQYNRFGDWSLALAAYNAGPTRVSREISSSNRGDGFNIPSSTKGYVQSILAAVGLDVNPLIGEPLEQIAVVPPSLLKYPTLESMKVSIICPHCSKEITLLPLS